VCGWNDPPLRNVLFFFSSFLPSFLILIGGTGVWTQGFALGKQVLDCLSHSSSPFLSGYFGDGVSWTICLHWPWTQILSISASQVTKITDVSHGCPTSSFFYCGVSCTEHSLMELCAPLTVALPADDRGHSCPLPLPSALALEEPDARPGWRGWIFLSPLIQCSALLKHLWDAFRNCFPSNLGFLWLSQVNT
jgi:hypothetical protein